MTRDELIRDKERMDDYAKKLQDRKPIKEWALLYWTVVAVGHILEWVVRKK